MLLAAALLAMPALPELATPPLVTLVSESNIAAPMTMAAVNALDRPAFVAAFGGIVEHSPWIAERAWSARPFASPDALHVAMVATMRSALPAEALALLNAHPELAGKEARARQMTDHSAAEQRSAGLDALSGADFDRFDRLNAAYRAKFGFPFIIAVRGRSGATILSEFERRLANDPDTEREAAFGEIATITRLRLDRKVAPGG